jgi:hypothetical protein
MDMISDKKDKYLNFAHLVCYSPTLPSKSRKSGTCGQLSLQQHPQSDPDLPHRDHG